MSYPTFNDKYGQAAVQVAPPPLEQKAQQSSNPWEALDMQPQQQPQMNSDVALSNWEYKGK